MADDVPLTARQFVRLRRLLAEHTDRNVFYCPDERLWVCVLLSGIDIHVSTDLDPILDSLESVAEVPYRPMLDPDVIS